MFRFWRKDKDKDEAAAQQDAAGTPAPDEVPADLEAAEAAPAAEHLPPVLSPPLPGEALPAGLPAAESSAAPAPAPAERSVPASPFAFALTPRTEPPAPAEPLAPTPSLHDTPAAPSAFAEPQPAALTEAPGLAAEALAPQEPIAPAALEEPQPAALTEAPGLAAEALAPQEPAPAALAEPQPAALTEAPGLAAEALAPQEPAPAALAEPQPAELTEAPGLAVEAPGSHEPVAPVALAEPQPAAFIEAPGLAAEAPAPREPIAPAALAEPQPAALTEAPGLSVEAPVSHEPVAPAALAAPQPAALTEAPGLATEALAPQETAAPAAPAEPKLSWFQRLRRGLSRSTGRLTDGIAGIFTKRKLGEEELEQLEELLIGADLGPHTAMRLVESLRRNRIGKEITAEEVRALLAAEAEALLAPVAKPWAPSAEHRPHVVLVCGVNGVGKTTTIGKVARKLQDEGRSVMLAAGDTFRAAAVEQLRIWGERTGAPVVHRAAGADAAGLVFDAMAEARKAEAEVLLVDTAGRLQNKSGLMDELAKIVRVMRKQDPTAPHDVWLILDATTGQNAHAQVEVFKEMVSVTGLIVTKLDGSAKGGVLVGLADRFGLPVHFIGVGETAADLQPFEADEFSQSLLGL